MLEVNNLRVEYGAVKALKEVSLKIDKGEIVSIIGSNGAGKSTLLKTISGLVKPKSGEILYQNKNITNLVPNKIVKFGIAQAPEGRQLFSEMSVRDNLLMGAYLNRNPKEVAKKLQEIYEMFPRLYERKNQAAGSLSGGEQQMVNIGRALMSMPQLLMLDEPSFGLAPKIVEQIGETILLLAKQGLTILLVEQSALMALELSSRSYVLENGSNVLSGLSKELMGDPSIQKAYMGA
ncbi:ABC transporter ATP-binding protein [Bacillus sp. FJAT-29953]|nr:ABC transporter ATP-binding protein [Bacillus sp. FJAT-29953]